MAQKTSTKRELLVADLEQQLEAATKAQADKLAQSEKHLLAQLEMAAKKYRTVNGYMQARSTLEQVAFGRDLDAPDTMAVLLAGDMSALAEGLASKISLIDIMVLDDSVLEGELDEDFIDNKPYPAQVARQMLVVNLLQNVGPVIDDIVSFRESTNEAIASIKTELAKARDNVVSIQTLKN